MNKLGQTSARNYPTSQSSQRPFQPTNNISRQTASQIQAKIQYNDLNEDSMSQNGDIVKNSTKSHSQKQKPAHP